MKYKGQCSCGSVPDRSFRRAGRHGLLPLPLVPILVKCCGHLMTTHPTLGLVDVFAATLPTLEFKPGVHVNYAETVLPMRDGLPKLKDFPAELGGSGEVVPK